MCATPASCAARSSALPGVVAAWATNVWSSREESAISSTLTNASTRIVPQMNSVGPSTPTAPMAATFPCPPWANSEEVAATTMVSTKATASPPSVMIRWAGRRRSRGTNASIRTPTTPRPKTSSSGESWPYWICGGVIVATARDPVTGCFPSGSARRRAHEDQPLPNRKTCCVG